MDFWSKIDEKRSNLIKFTNKTKSRRIIFGIIEFVITFIVFNAFTFCGF